MNFEKLKEKIKFFFFIIINLFRNFDLLCVPKNWFLLYF